MELDIREKIIKDFGEDALTAIQLIEAFELKWKLSPRVSRCIVHLAKGNIATLKKSIKDAEIDWRDVINWAETIPFEFNKPFKI